MPRASLHGTSHGPTHTAQPRQPCARCLSHHARRSARKARFSEMVTRPPPPRVRGRPGQLLGVSSRRTAPIHRWLLPPRCHAPLSPPLPAVLSPLRACVASRPPHLSVSRVAFASARAQPPSHADDRPVGPPSGPNACRAVAERQSRGRRARPDRSDSPACSRSSRAA